MVDRLGLDASTLHLFALLPSDTVLISLGVTVLAQKTILKFSDAKTIVHFEVVAAGSARATAQPGDGTKGKADETNGSEVRVLGYRDANVEEELLERGDCELGLNDLGPIDDLVECLHDGCAADEDIVSSHCAVPVSSTLFLSLAI